MGAALSRPRPSPAARARGAALSQTTASPCVQEKLSRARRTEPEVSRSEAEREVRGKRHAASCWPDRPPADYARDHAVQHLRRAAPARTSSWRTCARTCASGAREKFAVWRCASCLSLHARDEVDLAHYYADYPFHKLKDIVEWMLQAMYRKQLSCLKAAGIGSERRVARLRLRQRDVPVVHEEGRLQRRPSATTSTRRATRTRACSRAATIA